MGEDHTIRAVERLRIDALYGKKKHFNAADRKERCNTYIGISLIVANAVIASNLAYMFISEIRTFGVIIGIIGLIATVLAVVQAFFNYSRTAEQHRMVAAKYLHIVKACSRVKAYHQDGILSADELRERLDTLAREYEQITESAVCLSTNRDDYEKAREGFEGWRGEVLSGEYQEE
jgi:hypothetical protein